MTRNDTQTPTHFLAFLERLDSRPVFIYNDEIYRYKTLHDDTKKLSRWMSNISPNKLPKTPKIMFSLQNSPLLVGLFFACWENGTDCYPINPRLIANELLNLVKRANPTILLIELSQHSNDLKNYCKVNLIQLITIDQPMCFLDALPKFNSSHNQENIRESTTFHISSGTGGHYYFHGHTTQQILTYAYRRQFDYGLKKGDLSLVHLSFNHAYAFSYQLLPNVGLGNCMVIGPSFEPRISLHLIQKHAITALALLPTMYHKLCEAIENKNLKVHHLRHLSIAGDQPTQNLIDRVETTIGKPLLNGIGMTEVFGYAQNQIKTRPHNKIHVFDEIQIKIEPVETIQQINIPQQNEADNLGQTLGEIHLKTMMQPTSCQTEWLATGDYGYIDTEHNLYFLGRIKDIIIKGGSKIAPLELEHYLHQHPDIQEVAIIGQKNALWGEVICACLVPTQSSTIILEKINHFLSQFIATYKHIDKLFLYPSLPLNVTGKIDRHLLYQEINS